ncbi:MAG: ABC transporter ATP-binding protein [Dehalococcoidales bacterium]|nr:ABC transporter ATP-binding protein [Dehalococcoidales bacterium]
MTDMAVILNGVSFQYGRLRVIDGISLQIPRGVSFGLLGPNGAGKTTLIRLLVGLLRPSSGSIMCLGQAPSRRSAHLIGYMPELPALYGELTVEQNIDFFARVYGLRDARARRTRVGEVISLIDLDPKRRTPVMKLSGGMKQRVSLGCAIVHKPPLLLLDEPTVGLDPELRVRFWEYFNDLTSRGTTIIISSHTMDDAAHCGQLIFLRHGRIVARGSPQELKAATGNPHASLEEAFLHFIRQSGEGDL